jgi:hypothetical protein
MDEGRELNIDGFEPTSADLGGRIGEFELMNAGRFEWMSAGPEMKTEDCR